MSFSDACTASLCNRQVFLYLQRVITWIPSSSEIRATLCRSGGHIALLISALMNLLERRIGHLLKPRGVRTGGGEIFPDPGNGGFQGRCHSLAAGSAGISVSSAHRIDRGRLQPKAAKPRGRRRPDPLAEVWEPLLLPLLERHPALTPTTLLEHLQEQKPDQDWSSLKRTLQRRVQHWKSLHGPTPEVMFPLAYQPGEIGFCDFTKVKRVVITLRGEPFPHLLFHYRLAWSGWSYGQLIHGRESFVAH